MDVFFLEKRLVKCGEDSFDKFSEEFQEKSFPKIRGGFSRGLPAEFLGRISEGILAQKSREISRNFYKNVVA